MKHLMIQQGNHEKPAKKLKILATSDLHGDKSLVKKLAERAEKEHVDLVVICGDLTRFEEGADGMIGPFLNKGKRVLFVPGNHESLATADYLSYKYKVKNLHGVSVKYGDVAFFGCGGANVGLHQVDDVEAYDLLTKGFEQIKDVAKKIMVTHVHPAGTKIERFTRFFKGSDGVRRAIEKLQPDIMLCGHVHEAEGIEEMIGKTRVINVCKNGKIFEL